MLIGDIYIFAKCAPFPCYVHMVYEWPQFRDMTKNHSENNQASPRKDKELHHLDSLVDKEEKN